MDVIGITPRLRLLALLHGQRPELAGVPVVESIDPATFSGTALVIAKVVPRWSEPQPFRGGGRPYASDIHACVNAAGLTAERYQPSREECEVHRLEPGETVFIVSA